MKCGHVFDDQRSSSGQAMSGGLVFNVFAENIRGDVQALLDQGRIPCTRIFLIQLPSFLISHNRPLFPRRIRSCPRRNRDQTPNGAALTAAISLSPPTSRLKAIDAFRVPNQFSYECFSDRVGRTRLKPQAAPSLRPRRHSPPPTDRVRGPRCSGTAQAA